MTFADFQTPGNTPSVKDLLIKPLRIGAMTSEASFNKRALSLSSPSALLVFKDLRALRTNFTVTSSRWNLKGGVQEAETVEMFWNGFANTFPTDTKYWFMILSTEKFPVCRFPFLKIEKTVDFLVPGSTCFIARHISQESPLASSIIRQKYFDFRFLFFMISIIPQFSVHFPVLSTISWPHTRAYKYKLSALGTYFQCEGVKPTNLNFT